jgi:predicted PurR-regulated permease PerM
MNKLKINSDLMLKQLNNAKLVRYILLFTLAWILVRVIAYFETVIVIFIFATIVAFLLDYPVVWLSRYLKRWIAVILVSLLALVILGILTATLGLTLVSQLQQLIEQAPQLLDSTLSLLKNLPWLQNRELTIDFNTWETQLQEQALNLVSTGLHTIQSLLFSLLDLILIVVVAFFMLLNGKPLWNLVVGLFPPSLREDLVTAISQNFLGFFWGRLLLSIFFGVSTFLVFILLGVPYALALSTLAGVFDLIPGIGATLGISLVCLIILPQGILLSLKVLVGCILLQQIEENLLMPRIMQGSINMNPVVMFFALLVGARIAGLIGVFLSIPIAGVLISLLDVKEMRSDKVN